MCFKSGFSIKKAIALSFLLLANTIILAHAIVCHHHHDAIPITLAATHHDDNCDSHDAQPIDPCNNSYCHGCIENCSLIKIYIRFNNERQLFQLHDFDFDRPSYTLTLFSDYSIPLIADDVGLPFRQKPYLLSYSTEYISQSLGLRAPPF